MKAWHWMRRMEQKIWCSMGGKSFGIHETKGWNWNTFSLLYHLWSFNLHSHRIFNLKAVFIFSKSSFLLFNLFTSSSEIHISSSRAKKKDYKSTIRIRKLQSQNCHSQNWTGSDRHSFSSFSSGTTSLSVENRISAQNLWDFHRYISDSRNHFVSSHIFDKNQFISGLFASESHLWILILLDRTWRIEWSRFGKHISSRKVVDTGSESSHRN